MIIATKVMLFIVALLFYLGSLSAANEKSGYYCLAAAVTVTVLLLAAIKVA